jgi:hypothetical protein
MKVSRSDLRKIIAESVAEVIKEGVGLAPEKPHSQKYMNVDDMGGAPVVEGRGEKSLIDFLSQYKFRVKGHAPDEHYQIIGVDEDGRLLSTLIGWGGEFSEYSPWQYILVEE